MGLEQVASGYMPFAGSHLVVVSRVPLCATGVAGWGHRPAASIRLGGTFPHMVRGGKQAVNKRFKKCGKVGHSSAEYRVRYAMIPLTAFP